MSVVQVRVVTSCRSQPHASSVVGQGWIESSRNLSRSWLISFAVRFIWNGSRARAFGLNRVIFIFAVTDFVFDRIRSTNFSVIVNCWVGRGKMPLPLASDITFGNQYFIRIKPDIPFNANWLLLGIINPEPFALLVISNKSSDFGVRLKLVSFEVFDPYGSTKSLYPS